MMVVKEQDKNPVDSGNAADGSETEIVEATSNLHIKDKMNLESDKKTFSSDEEIAKKPMTVLGVSIPPSLAEYDCHFRWAAKPKEKPFTEQEASSVLIETSKFNREDSTKDITLKYNGMKIIGDKATQVFCNIALDKAEDGKILMDEMSRLIKKCMEKQCFTEKYVQGLEYVLKGLEMFFLCHRIEKNGCEDAREKLKVMIQGLKAFESIDVKGQAAVRFMEHCFAHNRYLKGLEHVQLLKDIILLDNTYFLWYARLYALLRVRRRELFHGEPLGPNDEEKSMVLKAAELSPDNPFVITYVCRCLLEILRGMYNYNYANRYRIDPIEMGRFGTFTTSQQIVDFIQQIIQKPKELLEDTRWINVNLAEFFGTILPQNLRDNTLAKKYIQKALDDDPDSSKANHRMAAFCLTDKNPKEAIKYFKQAIATGPRNFPAVSDMILTMMGNIEVNAEDLAKVFQEHLENPRWGGDRRGNLYFLFGIFMFLKKDGNAAVDRWIEAYSKNPDSVKLVKNISYNYKRHRWNRQEISIQGIHSLLKTASTDIARSQKQKTAIKEILEIIDVIILEDNLRIQKAGDRGRVQELQEGQRGRSGTGDHGATCGVNFQQDFSRIMSDGRGDRKVTASDSDEPNWRSGCPGSASATDSRFTRGRNDNRGSRGRGRGEECRQQ